MAEYNFQPLPSRQRERWQSAGYLITAVLALASITITPWLLLSAVSLFWLSQQPAPPTASFRCDEKGCGSTADGLVWQLQPPVIITPIWIGFRPRIAGKVGPWQSVFVDQLQRADWARLQRISLTVNAAGLKL